MDRQNYPLITVFTPTYNRSHLLKRCYESLEKQQFKNFEWLIVDDGSTDDTANVVKELIVKSNFPIHYFFKPNGGKHTAINFGVLKSKSTLFYILDSDDALTVDALQIINEYWCKVDNNNFCGITGLCKYENGNIIGDFFLEEFWNVSFVDIYLKYHLKGDKAVCFKTEILKKYPFPQKDGINFVLEAVVWHEMAKTYNILAVNRFFQVVEYQDLGVSNSSYKKWYVTSLSFSYFNLIKNRTYPLTKYPKQYIWNFIHLGINSLLSQTSYFRELSFFDKVLYLICLPRAYYSYTNMKKLMNND